MRRALSAFYPTQHFHDFGRLAGAQGAGAESFATIHVRNEQGGCNPSGTYHACFLGDDVVFPESGFFQVSGTKVMPDF
jgi:hypothetical protein